MSEFKGFPIQCGNFMIGFPPTIEEMKTAQKIRIQWMRIMGIDDSEILDSITECDSAEEEQNQLDAAVRLNGGGGE